MAQILQELYDKFYQNFIYEDRWLYLWRGLLVTLEITFFALLIGLVLGFVVAVVRSSHDKLGQEKPRGALARAGRFFFGFLNVLCKIYLTVIRGTPILVQLMIIYFVIFANSNVDKVIVAIVGFGLNSGAYVAEIIRSGIMSVDVGQTEAGRSLGFSFVQTTVFIVMPQALKNILPALGNEFIVLIKETSVATVLAVRELMRAAEVIRSLSYDPFMPLVAVALIYLALVMLFSALVNHLERRLRTSER